MKTEANRINMISLTGQSNSILEKIEQMRQHYAGRNKSDKTTTGALSKEIMSKNNEKLKEPAKNLARQLMLANRFNLQTKNAYNELAENEGEIVFKLLCANALSIGAKNLYMKHSPIMEELRLSYPAFCKFILRLAIAKNDNKSLFNRAEDRLIWQVKRLIEYALQDKIITNEESELYLDIAEWDSNNFELVEKDILNKVIDWNYGQFKNTAPNVLLFIKSYYPTWYDTIMQPHIDEAKTRIKNT